MKASYRTAYGLPGVISIQEIPVPEPQEDEVLIRVIATTVSRSDAAILTGQPFILQFFTGLFTPKQPVTGSDFAGIVEKAGAKVEKLRPGDAVWGFDDNGCGSQAEYMCFSERKAIRKLPEGLSFGEAAASIEGAHYAINFINKVNINAGDKVMVNGGTGAIGSAMIQLLKTMGAHVNATCRGIHRETVRRLGAERIINYEEQDFTLDHEKYDFVFDAVGKSTFGKCKKLLKPGGTYISSELGPYVQNPVLALITPLTGGRKVRFPVPLNIGKSLDQISALLVAGKFRPLVDKEFSIDQVSEAYSYVISGQKVGNVILRLAEEKENQQQTTRL